MNNMACSNTEAELKHNSANDVEPTESEVSEREQLGLERAQTQHRIDVYGDDHHAYIADNLGYISPVIVKAMADSIEAIANRNKDPKNAINWLAGANALAQIIAQDQKKHAEKNDYWRGA